jgi:hypothetical protein
MQRIEEVEKQIKKEWRGFVSNKYTEPNIYFCRCDNQWFATMSDNLTICYFMSMTGKVYTAVKRKCEEEIKDGIRYYVIDNPYFMKAMSCRLIEKSDIVENFVLQNIISVMKSSPLFALRK